MPAVDGPTPPPAPDRRPRRLLLTGMSGTGKSTLVTSLRERGVAAVDLDEPPYASMRALEPGDEPDWVWDEAAVATLLDDASLDPLVVAGCAPNQGRFRDRIDTIVLLTASEDVTLHRLRTRTTNPFGRTEAEQAKVLADTAEVVPLLRAVADAQLDTDAPLDEVVAQVLALLEPSS